MREIKGTALLILPKFIEEKFGAENLIRWKESLKPSARQIYSAIIMPAAWFPQREFYHEPVVKMCELFYGGDLRGSYELGRFGADYALSGIYKFFVKLASVETLMRKAAPMMSTYHRPSKIEVTESSSNHAVLRITEFEDMQETQERDILGWIERAMEICGAKNIKIKTNKSLTKGDDMTEFEGTWE